MNEGELKHYGVMGMRWGHLRNKRLGNTKKAAGYKKQLDSKQKTDRKTYVAKAKAKAKETRKMIDKMLSDEKKFFEGSGKKYDLNKEKKFWDDYFKGDLDVNSKTKNYDRYKKVENAVANALMYWVA